MQHPDQLARMLGNKGDVARLLTLRKGIRRSVAVKLQNAVGLIMRRDKLVEYFARECSHGCRFRRLNLAIDY